MTFPADGDLMLYSVDGFKKSWQSLSLMQFEYGDLKNNFYQIEFCTFRYKEHNSKWP